MLNKKQIITIVSSLSVIWMATNAQAALTGPYVGGQLGWGNVHQAGFNGEKANDSGIAGRVFGGFQFWPYFAAETGFTKFSNVTSHMHDSGFNVNGTIKSYAVDVVGKGILPLQNGFSLYGKLGAAYLKETAHVSVANVGSGSSSEGKILPTFGVGASYDVTKCVVADVSWNRIQKVGHTNLGSTDLISLGLGYYFG